MFWRPITITGRPTLLVIDASCNLGGWENAFCDRIFSIFQRRGLLLKDNALARVQRPSELGPHLQPEEAFNCILLFSHGKEQDGASGAGLKDYWKWFSDHSWTSPKLFAACTWESHDPVVSGEILESPQTFAPLALAAQSPLTPREAGLYFMKFFAEIDLHTSDTLTGRMVWFSASKAKELLRRRSLMGNVGVRC